MGKIMTVHVPSKVGRPRPFNGYAPVGTLLGLGLLCAPTAQADFVADSKGSLEARNFYFNRDFRQDGSPGCFGHGRFQTGLRGRYGGY